MDIVLEPYFNPSYYDGCYKGLDISPSQITLGAGERKAFRISIDRRYIYEGHHSIHLKLRTTDYMQAFEGGVHFDVSSEGEFADCNDGDGDTDGEDDSNRPPSSSASSSSVADLKITTQSLKTIGQAVQVIGGQGGVGEGPLYELGGRVSAGASIATQVIDLTDRAQKLKQIAADIQATENEIEKSRYYGEALENYFAIEADLIKLIGPTVALFGVSTTAASSGLLVPAYIFAGIGSIARSVMDAASGIFVDCDVFGLTNPLVSAVQQGVCTCRTSSAHSPTFCENPNKPIYRVRVQPEKVIKRGLWPPWDQLVYEEYDRLYGVKSSANWNVDNESLDLHFAFWSQAEHVETDAFDTVEVTVTAIYRFGHQEYRVRMADFDLIEELRATEMDTVYSGTIQLPWRAIYGSPTSVEIAYRQPTSPGGGAFALNLHSL